MGKKLLKSVRKKTISETLWPDVPPDFMYVASSWPEGIMTGMLDSVWQAYDLLCKEILSQIDLTQPVEQLERNITELLERRIQRSLSGYEPFQVQHESWEWETRTSSQAQPPQYDIAFVLNENERVKWPLEAKVLPTDKAISPYIQEILENFLTCRYAPFSSEGGMLGYLITGVPGKLFNRISSELECVLSYHPSFTSRNHRTSLHKRIVPNNKNYPAAFSCHHLVMPVSPSHKLGTPINS
jgi:hypothetical protein